MQRYRIVFLLLCGVLALIASTAEAKNELKIFDVPTIEIDAAQKSAPAGTINLVLEEFSVPETAVPGFDIADATTLVVRNDGPDPLPHPILVRVLVSDSPDVPLPSEIYVLWAVIPVLAAGEAWTYDGPVVIPFTTLPGTSYLIAQIDPFDEVVETDETDNSLSLPVEIAEAPQTLAYYEDFQGGDGGWVPRDLSVQDIHLQHTFYFDDATETELGVWWCGDDDFSWGTPPGYGSSWDQRLTKDFTISNGEVTRLNYAIQFDTEPGNDIIFVEISDNNGGMFKPLAEHSGSSYGEFQVFSQDISAYIDKEVLIRFRFVSDGSWDDEAGNFDTNGAFRLDYVEVSGYDQDDFEFDGGGWTPSTAPPVGGEFRLVAEPAYSPGLPGDVYDTGEPATTCNAWVAYDPGTLEFPDASPSERAAGRDLEIVIESPEIILPTPYSRVLLAFDVYQDLPVENGIFFRWFVGSDADGWRSDGFIYYGTEGWNHREFDVTSFLPPGATTLQVRLGANDFGHFWNWDPETRNAAPFFDNVSILVADGPEPGLDPVDYPRACGWSVDDLDGDGVYDVDDLCPTESAAFFDRDGDGCLDPVIGSRHLEYWSADTLPLDFVIHQDGAPGITDGSDLTAVQDGFMTWLTVAGAEVSLNYEGTTADPNANAMDLVNTVTFSDPDYQFPSGVLAVGLSTSYLTPVVDGDTVYRPGQIIDADMIFNPTETFQTPTMGSGVDIQSIVTHEAGHMLGLSHSAVSTSTMFFVLPPGTNGSVLSVEDEMAMFRAYPEESALAGANHLRGSVYDGLTGAPVPGVIAFAIEALPGDALGDTVACEYTLPRDGSYHFAGLADGEYFVAIHALDGSSSVGYIQPGNINQLIYNEAETLIVPEFWDDAESATDDSELRTPLSVSGGMTTVADLITNIDDIGPWVEAFSPLQDAVDVDVSTAVLFQFSEAVDGGSFVGNFNFTPAAGGDFVPGNAALVQDDLTLMYVPSDNLEFETTYEVEIGAGVRDLFGNVMGTPFTLTFTTGPQPPVFINNLSPNKGIGGALVVINGGGFGTASDPATVTIGGVSVPLLEWASDRLLVAVPTELSPQPYDLVVVDPGSGSATTLFTVLEPDQVARGLEIATLDLPGLPRVVDVSPDGQVSLVAMDVGLAAVDVSDPANPTLNFIPVDGGLTDLVVSPDGHNIYAVSRINEKLYRFQYDPAVVPPGEPVTLLNEIPLGEVPIGITVDPTGKWAYVSTLGEVQIWDFNTNSATFENQVGVLTGTGPVLLGPMAIDPAGNILLAATANGKLAVFDLEEKSLETRVSVLSTPTDIQVDPRGNKAYVTDDSGYLTVVDLTTFTKEADFSTGGSLQGAAVTPTASFIYATNHQADKIDVVDLREGSPTYLGLAARIPSRVNPVDLVFSPDGIYFYSLVELEQKFVVSAVGAGPLLTALSPAAGPVGTQVVLAGSEFTGATVSFNGTPVLVDHGGPGYLTITIPPGTESGPVTVLGENQGEISNSINFNVLTPGVEGKLNSAGIVSPVGDASLANDLVVAPGGKLVLIGGQEGALHLFDTDPSSSGYHQFLPPVTVFSSAVAGMAVAPNASVAYLSNLNSANVSVVDIDTDSGTFGDILREISLGGAGLGALATSPDGRHLLAFEPSAQVMHLFDLVADVDLVTPIPQGTAREITFHPGGIHAYLTIQADDPAVVLVLDLDSQTEGFGSVIATVTLPDGVPAEVPQAVSFSPDGNLAYIMTSQETGTPHRTLLSVDTSNPSLPGIPQVLGIFDSDALPMAEHLRISPVGDRAVMNIRGDGLYHVGLSPLDVPTDAEQTLGNEPLAFAFAPDGARLYVADTEDDSIHIFDFDGDLQMVKVWGDGQTGVAQQTLASSLRVRLIDLEGEPSAGTAVTFAVKSGGGLLGADTPPSVASLTLATDVYGFAQVNWQLGPDLGNQQIIVTAPGAAGSPAVFDATAIADPELLPLELVENLFYPVDGSVDISVTTALQGTFSRAVDPSSIHVDSFFLWDNVAAVKIPTVVGFSNANLNVSLTPVNELTYETAYTVVVTGDVRDSGGGSLINPADISFVTESAPPVPVLTAVSPPSSTTLVSVMLSGTGFDPVTGSNAVFFVNGETNEETAAFVGDGGTDYLLATVPSGSESGTVYVSNSAGVSNPLPFAVLEESSLPVDEVIGTVGTGTPTRSVTVSPDGAMAYAVSPDADVVVPIDLNTLASLPSIPVGDEPWAIAMHPAGTFVYVANRQSGDVSVVDVLAGSGSLHDVVETLNVGLEPVDIVVTPGGDRVIVANFGSEDLSIIDTDETSSSFHNVIGTVGTGSGSRSVTVSPDGARIYVGTDDGYLVIGTLDFAVIGTVGTGRATRHVTVSPDGTILVLLDVLGDITLYDITPGSDSENQVIGTVSTGSGARVATVSPDGALLYVVMEEGDIVQIYDIEVISSIGVVNDPSGLPVPELELVGTINPGENPEFLQFYPDGSGRFVVTNSGEINATVYGTPTGPGMVTGRVYADCPEPDTGLYGVQIDIYSNDTGDLLTTLVTDTLGYYSAELPAGEYNATLLTPLAHSIEEEVQALSISGAGPVTLDWLLDCRDIVPTQRPMSYWKRQIGAALRNDGSGEISAETLCHYLDNIELHFNNHAVNRVIVYDPPESDECVDKLLVAKDLLNLWGFQGVLDVARAQAMALLFNVASGKISLLEEISEDGVPLSRAITYIDLCIDDGLTRNDYHAVLIGFLINHGWPVPAGMIPNDVPDISYLPRLGRNFLGQNFPNPFNPTASIRFEIARPEHVRLKIFDLSGRLVKTLVDEPRQPNSYVVVWDGTDDRGGRVASGVYFYRMSAGSFVETRKMMLLK